jgi:hypothetical protein
MALASQIGSKGSQHPGLGFPQRSGEVAAGGKSVAAATQLECHLCDVESGHCA